MRRCLSVLFLVTLCATITTTSTRAEVPGAQVRPTIDTYVMRLIWMPSLCVEDASDPACAEDRPQGFALDGFWPVRGEDVPLYCLREVVAPLRRDADAMDDIMRSGDWAWHQWKKHGSCSGLRGREYFKTARRAYQSIESPAELDRLVREVTVPIKAITDTMLIINPELPADGLSVTCLSGRMHEMLVCLDPELNPTACAPRIRQSCAETEVAISPPR